MRWIERQKKIEERTYEAIEEIAEELNVEVPFYPEVWWKGRNLSLDDLGLSKEIQAGIESYTGLESYYLYKPQIILISKDLDFHIAEESAHFLHLISSGIKKPEREGADIFYLEALIETFGFFGSKIICPERENHYLRTKDILSFSPRDMEEIFDSWGNRIQATEFLIHQQGYCLGERLYYSYINGDVSKKYLRKLFLSDFAEEGEATKTFLRLRNRFWKFDVVKDK